jgi:hypothetical protein
MELEEEGTPISVTLVDDTRTLLGVEWTTLEAQKTDRAVAWPAQVHGY